MKPRPSRLLRRISILLLTASCSALASPSPGTALTPEQVAGWREDLAFLDREAAKQHPNLFHTLPREAWERKLAQLSDALPDLAPHQAVVELARIVAAVGDGHTRLTLPLAPGIDFFRGHSETPQPHDPAFVLRQLPLRLGLFEDGLVVTAVGPDHRELLGARVLRIGTLSADRATDAVAPTIQRDNEMGVRLRLPERLVLPEVLHACGVTPSPNRATFILEGRLGRPVTVSFEALPPGRTVDWVGAPSDALLPLYLRHPERPFWLEPMPDRHALYVRYRECANQDGETAAFAERILEALRTPGIDYLVLDLRGNPGGDNSLNLPLLHAMIRADVLRRPGRLFVLIDRGTFSAALMLAVDLERHTPAIFVGEPTGGKPNHFGDSRKIELPKTGLTVRVSTLEWQYSSPRDDRPWVPPHLPVAVTSEQALAGRDPVLEAVLDGIGPAESSEPGALAAALAGTWKGSLTFAPLRLDATLELMQKDGTWSGRMDIPDQGIEHADLRDLRLDGPRLTFELPVAQDQALGFEGRFEHGWIAGTFEEEGREIAVFLRRP